MFDTKRDTPANPGQPKNSPRKRRVIRVALPVYPIWLSITRPIIILACVLVAFYGFRWLVLKGTFFEASSVYEFSTKDVTTYSAAEYMRAGEYGKAVGVLEKVLEKQPNHGQAHMFLGRIYLQQHKFELAKEHYAKAQVYLPGNGESPAALKIIPKLAAENAPSQPVSAAGD